MIDKINEKVNLPKLIRTFINISYLIIKKSKKIIFQFVGYNDQVKHIFNFLFLLKKFEFS
ncbi:hypothetical protein JCM12294_45150 [Desulfocicer niacini]